MYAGARFIKIGPATTPAERVGGLGGRGVGGKARGEDGSKQLLRRKRWQEKSRVRFLGR